MNRRSLLAGAAAVTASLGLALGLGRRQGGERQSAEPATDAPTLDIVEVGRAEEGRDQWRVRSWAWNEGAWRPHIAHVTRDRAAVTLSGRVAPLHRVEVQAWMSALERA